MPLPPFLQRIAAILERLLKTDIRYITKGALWLTSAKLVTSLASLVTSVVFANRLSQDTYGIYTFILSIVSIFTITTLSGVDTALIKAVARGFTGDLLPIVFTKIRWGLLGAAGSLIMALYYSTEGNTTLVSSFCITAFFVPFLDSFYLYSAYWSGKKAFARNTKYHLIGRAIVVPILLATVLLTENVLILLTVYFGIYTLLRLVFLSLTLKEHVSDGSKDPTIIRYGKHLSVMSVIGVISTTLDKVLIFHYGGAAVLAGYYLAITPLKQLRGFVGALNDLALPKFSTGTRPLLRRTLIAKVGKLSVIIIPIIAAYFLLAPRFFAVFYPKYLEYVPLSKAFMVLLLLQPFTLFHTALTSWGAKKQLYSISTIPAVVRIALLALLVPAYGVTGAIIAVAVTNITSSALSFVGFLQQSETSHELAS